MLNHRETLKAQDRTIALSASEPPSLFVLKSLLYPIVPVLTLGGCVLLWGAHLQGAYLLIAVLAFIGAADLLDVVPLEVPRAPTIALSSLLNIVLRWLFVVAFIWALLEIAGLSDRFDWRVLVTWAIVTPLLLWFGQLSAPHLFVRASSKRKARRAVIVGATEVGEKLAERLHDSSMLNIEVLGFFDDRTRDRMPKTCAARMLGRLPELSGYAAIHEIELVYITLPMARHPRVTELLNSLRDSTVSIYFVPDFTVCDLVQPRFDLVNGIPVLAVCESPFYGVRGIVKRALDLLIAVTVLVILAPVMLGVAAAVRLTSPGPAVFKQKRYGLDGKEIIIYKFRSMRVTEDGKTTYTQVRRDDDRVTPVGAFIRSTSLDELPQLFNVLEGSMSIVGPRPHAIAVNEQYRRLIPGYMVRHKVKPGITGWAQVNGFRGGDDLGSMRQRIAFDLEYLQQWSLTLDLLIIAKTAFVVLKDRHAY